MRGGRYHELLRGARFLATATTAALYRLVDLVEYPALLPGSTRVHGELFAGPGSFRGRQLATLGNSTTRPHFRTGGPGPVGTAVPANMVDGLDELEGHPDLYLRTTLTMQDGSFAAGYVLVDARAAVGAPTLNDGRWTGPTADGRRERGP